MAAAIQKKSSSGTRAGGSTTRKNTTGKKTNKRAPAKAPTKNPIRREVGGIVLLLLALFSALGYFQTDGIFINFFANLLKGIMGYGYWLAPPLLLLGAYILGFHRGRPVRLRLFCTLLLPIMMGAFLHLLLSKGDYPWAFAMVSALWSDGLVLHSGGVLGGVLSLSLAAVFSSIGCGVVLVVLTLLMLLCAFNRTILDIITKLRERPRRVYEYQEPTPKEDTPRAPKTPNVERMSKVVSPADFDIPPPTTAQLHAQPAPPPPEKKRKFFDRERRVPTPDEVLSGAASHPPVAEPLPVEEAPFEAPFEAPTPADAPPPPPVPLEIVTPKAAPAITKVTPKETAQAASEVTAEIAATLTEAAPAYQYPPVSLLEEGVDVVGDLALGELKQNQDRLSDTIRSFGIDATISGVVRGPSVTRYELELDQGIRLNKLTNLADDIALSLGAEAVRIAPIPDKISTVGIEVPNKLVSTVHIHDVLNAPAFCNHSSKVAFSVGKDIGGNAIIGNIAKLPHLLIAGTTGSGKSVCTNSLIISLLYKSTPDEVRLIMVDPKMVELGIYNGIPHLLIPVVTDPKKAAGALQWAVTEMMKRYRAFSEVGVRDLASYNAKAAHNEDLTKMPQVVVLIDELADLMLVAAKEVEESICRVAQMGRAAGMHLVIATQRPSADVITGLMKANIPSRIAFAVSSSLESRIILDTTGAEKLVGKGDMLWFPLGAGKPLRVQGCFVTDEEVAAVVDFVKKSGNTAYDESIIQEIEHHVEEKEKGSKGVGGTAPDDVGGDFDELLPSAIEVVLELGQASVSMLQRRLKLGYGRAARLVDQMEEKGIVGPFEGSKPRQLLITKAQWQELQYRQGIAPAPGESEVPPPFDPDPIDLPDEVVEEADSPDFI